MKIVLFGDSITDMGRDRINNQPNYLGSYGCGYPIFIAGELYKQDPTKHVIYNRGISGNRIVDLYARIKMDVWNLKPDVLSILIGINDIWHEIGDKNGVDIVRLLSNRINHPTEEMYWMFAKSLFDMIMGF